MRHVASAPFPVHHLFTRLFRLGVIKFEQGAYSQISRSLAQDQFLLNDVKAQVLIAPRLLAAKADTLSAKILAKTKIPALGERIYDKGRASLHQI
jgi:hypothetical protein